MFTMFKANWEEQGQAWKKIALEYNYEVEFFKEEVFYLFFLFFVVKKRIQTLLS